MSGNQTEIQALIQDGCYPFDISLYGQTPYGYVPSTAAGIVFCALFGLSMTIHIFLTAWSRLWWTSVFAIGALTEIIGWVGRTWSASCPYNNDAFLMQITTLIIAPTFFTAGLYIILGRLIHLVGKHTSPISPRIYLYIFCTCDVVSLAVQAVGGALASIASTSVPPGDTSTGTEIMVGGIIFQMVAVTVFSLLFILFLHRSRHSNLPSRLKYLLWATSFATILIYVRSIYRTIELLQGWTGFLITHEIYFVILDGAMMVLVAGIFNLIHPALFGLKNIQKGGTKDEATKAETDSEEQAEGVSMHLLQDGGHH